MAKVTKEELQRYAGAQWFEGMVKSRGLEEASKELKGRINFGVPLRVSQKDLDDCVNRIKINTIKTMVLMSALVLADEFDFEQADINRFSKRFNDKVEVLNYDLAEWKDYQQILKDEYGIEFELTEDVVGSKEMEVTDVSNR